MEVTAYTTSRERLPVALSVRVRMTRITCAACAKQAVDTGMAVGGEYGDRAGLGPAVPALASDVPPDLGPGQPGERGVQRRLVPVDREQVVRAPAGQGGRVLALGVQGVRGDEDHAQVGQGVQGRGERGDLVAVGDRPLRLAPADAGAR